ncbi:hypothetical protein DCC85_21340 [Paenibacillus sp. CAA11]|uniref:hypothetical protein n=1 Tax=Paenibacillus sp. CAA11 TaxID=1532905 RepID=UPI000D3BD3C5|nr:hypothetical protein [Paenibacillus sp. CAA11]AWB46462.1 hypothetical protein DCC85_21340 [Paenibacillus sp. CAA11]
MRIQAAYTLARRSLILLLAICLLSLASLSKGAAQAAVPQPMSILLIYDSLAKGTPSEGNVEALQRLLAAFKVKVVLTDFDSYEPGTLSRYNGVIAVRSAPDLQMANKDYEQDMARYQGEYLHIGNHIPGQLQRKLSLKTAVAPEAVMRLQAGSLIEPSVKVTHLLYMTHYEGRAYGSLSSQSLGINSPYAVLQGGSGFIPYFQQGNLSEFALAYVLKDWLQIKEKGHQYLLIQEVYPFSDLARLTELADRLYTSGVPFAVSVRPVFSNTDYPAMQRYLQALEYVQTRNGSILVQVPVVAEAISQGADVLKQNMAGFIDVLAEHGIAPLGVVGEMYWSYDKMYAAQGMGFFDSSVLLPNRQVLYSQQMNTSMSFASSAYSLDMDKLQQLEQKEEAPALLPMDTALTVNFPENEAAQEQLLQQLKDSWLVFDDYKQADHQVKTSSHTSASQNGTLQIDGQAVDLTGSTGRVTEDYAYTQKAVQSFSGLFRVQNYILVVIIATALVVFTLFLIIGYRLYKRKYYK